MDVSFLTSAFQEDQFPEPDRPEVAFAGRSNVGKSSLINTLVGRKRLARTSSTPGRTRSINFFSVGDSLYLVDLPGYGFARVPMKVRESWRQLVEAYLRTRANLKAVVLIMDIRRGPASGDLDLMEWLEHYAIPVIMVLTKVDKLSRQQAKNRVMLIARQTSALDPDDITLFSAKTGEGRQELWERIKSIIQGNTAYRA